MIKRLTLLFAIIAACITQASAFTTVEPPKGSDGFYEISSAEQLAWFRDYVNTSTDNASASARLMADIDLSPVCSATVGSWEPIGKNGVYVFKNCWKGSFDGNGKTISNLYINDSSANCQALFGRADGAISNLTVKGDITASACVALIAAYTESKDVTGCVSYGSVNGRTDVGTIAGKARFQGKIIKCTNYASVSGATSSHVGGIVGIIFTTTVSGCTNFGDVTPLTQVMMA